MLQSHRKHASASSPGLIMHLAREAAVTIIRGTGLKVWGPRFRGFIRAIRAWNERPIPMSHSALRMWRSFKLPGAMGLCNAGKQEICWEGSGNTSVTSFTVGVTTTLLTYGPMKTLIHDTEMNYGYEMRANTVNIC